MREGVDIVETHPPLQTKNLFQVTQGDEYVNGKDAEFKCNFLDAELTDVDTPEELKFLGELIKAGGATPVYVGLRRINGQFLYKNGTSIGHVRWCHGEPNGGAGNLDTCGFLVPWSEPCLGDNACSTERPRFLCKKPEAVLKTQCETGWKYFNGNCYLFWKNKIDYVEAEKSCQSMGAELTDIDNKEELKFVGDLIKFNDGGYYPLIGLKRINDRFLYKNGTSIGYIKWCENQPSEWMKEGDKCCFIKYDNAPEYCIDDSTCTGYTSYVCKKEKV